MDSYLLPVTSRELTCHARHIVRKDPSVTIMLGILRVMDSHCLLETG